MTATPLVRPPTPARIDPTPVQDWRVLLTVFWLTSMVEGLGVSQIFALVPSYLRQMGVPQDERLAFVGLFSALIFVVGMPLARPPSSSNSTDTIAHQTAARMYCNLQFSFSAFRASCQSAR